MFSLLTYGMCLIYINVFISALPAFFVGTLKQKTVVKHFDRVRRRCLWANDDLQNRHNSLVAWTLVCRPKKKGGLGVINLQVQNEGLLLKQLHKIY